MGNQPHCCIVGAGPAGMMLALLLARAGLRVVLLERHNNFDRDFRGDTVHASTLEVLDQLGLAQAALQLPHQKLSKIQLHTPQRTIDVVDLSRLPSRFPYVAIMPQAQLLDFLCAEAESYPNFTCIRGASVQGLLARGGRVEGVTYRHAGSTVELTANLVVATDGRYSRLRKEAGLVATAKAPPMDVCWLRLPRKPQDGFVTGGFFINEGRMLVCLPRPDTWQMGYVFAKGNFAELKAQGLDSLRRSLADTAPWLADRVDQITQWDDLHLLNVQSDCLQRWHKPGLLMLGDAAHVMSPVGGVGINFAIADAVEAANVLACPDAPLLAGGPVPESVLAQIQRRRMLPTRIIQTFQGRVQETVVQRALRGRAFQLPAVAKAILATPLIRRLPLRLIGLGFPQAKLRC